MAWRWPRRRGPVGLDDVDVYASAPAEGWLDQAAVDAVAAEMDAWAERPAAFSAALYREAVGWVEDRRRGEEGKRCTRT